MWPIYGVQAGFALSSALNNPVIKSTSLVTVKICQSESLDSFGSFHRKKSVTYWTLVSVGLHLILIIYHSFRPNVWPTKVFEHQFKSLSWYWNQLRAITVKLELSWTKLFRAKKDGERTRATRSVFDIERDSRQICVQNWAHLTPLASRQYKLHIIFPFRINNSKCICV